MGGIAIDLLPGDAELARRAAGGDGAAFVRLYDHYSADVFEESLGATGSVEHAADATQAAFLRLLRRPPAIDAPDSEVVERLRAMALSAGVDAAPLSRRTAEGGHAPAGAGAGWLRSETVAKAGARFDADWSGYLASPASGDRTATEIAHAWDRAAAEPPLAVERVESERPVAAIDPEPAAAPAEPQRRRLRALFVMPRIPLPSTGALAAFLTVAVFGAALGVVLAGGGEGTAPSGPAASAGPPGADTPAAPKARREDRAGRRQHKARRGAKRGTRRALGGSYLARGEDAAGQSGLELAGYHAPYSGGYRGGTGGGGGARLRAGGGGGGGSTGTTRQISSPTPTSGSPDTTREPSAMNVAPPSDPPPPDTSSPAPSEPAPTSGDSGGSPNCHSSKSSNPC
jgi:hypothetical protein